MTRFTVALFLLFACWPVGSVAAPAELYSGEVVVSSQDASERREALPLALRQVLQKLSGLYDFEEFPQVEPALEAAPSMLLTYYYRNADLTLPDGSQARQLRLVGRFDPSRVDELARSLELPVWQPERPPLMTWLVVDDGLDRRVLPIEFRYVQDSMADVAAARGMPLRWPEPAPDGTWDVDLQLLWGGYTEELDVPEGEGVMIAAARREGADWGVRINLEYQGRNWAWRVDDPDLEVAMNVALNQAIDQIAAANSIAAADLGSWEQVLNVSGLAGAGDYQRCLGYLQGLSVVERVDVVSARPGEVSFRLGLNALPRYLEEALQSGSVLEWVDGATDYRMRREGAGSQGAGARNGEAGAIRADVAPQPPPAGQEPPRTEGRRDR